MKFLFIETDKKLNTSEIQKASPVSFSDKYSL